MKIEIDTSRDNNDEIRRIIKMLQAYVGESVSSDSSQNYEAPSEGMFNIFDNDSGKSSDDEDNDDDSGKEEEKDNSVPRIQIIDY